MRNRTQEEWRDIKGYEGHYQISNYGVRDSLYFQIRQTGLDCIREGSIDAPTLEAICKAHDTYEKLGENGYIDSIMDRVNKLPIKDE